MFLFPNRFPETVTDTSPEERTTLDRWDGMTQHFFCDL